MDVTIAFWQFLLIIVGLAGIWASTRRMSGAGERAKEEAIFSEMSPDEAFEAMKQFGRDNGYIVDFYDPALRSLVFDDADRSPIGVVFAASIQSHEGKHSMTTITAQPKVAHLMPTVGAIAAHFIAGAKAMLQKKNQAVTAPAPH